MLLKRQDDDDPMKHFSKTFFKASNYTIHVINWFGVFISGCSLICIDNELF